MRDSSSLRVQDRRASQSDTVCMSRVSFSAGRRSSPLTVSIVMPRKVIVELGPSVFSGARGTPNRRHSLLKM